ncbi:MAG: EAL domain-containing protein [Campylobacterales bacterium]
MECIDQILERGGLTVYFQPILSMRGRALFGVEALIRSVTPGGEIIAPAQLFAAAIKEGKQLELDRAARRLAIHAFAPLWRIIPRLLLFVNFESQLIDTFNVGNYLFDGELRRLKIPYSNIVLEIKEDEVTQTKQLESFCRHYRDLGLNIALDDFGVGQSSFDRLAIVRPDIIKIDQSLITHIQVNYIHQEIVHAICKMSENIGALSLAEGIETLEESVCCLAQGATLMQGFWFARPAQPFLAKSRHKNRAGG